MDVTLARLSRALRRADVAVSPVETMDALAVVRQVGLDNPRRLRQALALTLAKTVEEKQHFETCFDRFFGQLAFSQAPKRSFFRDLDPAGLDAALAGKVSPELSARVQMLAGQRTAALAPALQEAAQAAGVDQMRHLRDKPHYAAAIAAALGTDELDAVLSDPDIELDSTLIGALRYVRHYLREQAQDYVDLQYQLNIDASGRKAIVDAALKANLTHLPKNYQQDMQRAVSRIADRLCKSHRRRRRRARRGQLDIKRTLRHNVAYDGALFDLHWRRQKPQKATVFAICDVSGSVAGVARFLLLMLYNLSDVLPNIRTFAFSSEMAEVTDVFRRKGAEAAVESVLFDWGKGNTDYGRALMDFRKLALDDINRQSTVIILGDGRNNHYQARVERLAEISARARQVIWLNPEPRESWGTGDSEMTRYAPHCFRVRRCSSLQDLSRFADELVAAQD